MAEMGGNVPKRLRVLPTEEVFSIVKHQLAEAGIARVRVTGNSMYPLLRHLRDSVLLRPPENIRPGDIVLFDRRNGRYALHRVIRMGEIGFTMAGDNQWHFERNLPYDQVVGVMSVIIRNGREISAGNFFIKIYAQAVRLFTMPRIYLYKAIRSVIRHKPERMETRQDSDK